MERERAGEAEDREPRYPIGAVARRTGLSLHVLRAWERRYRVVEPGRTATGGRLYSSADVLRLRLLRRVTEAGHPIGQVAGLETEALLSLARVAEPPVEAVGVAGEAGRDGKAEAERYAVAALGAVEALDGRRLRATLMRAVVALTGREFVDELVVPLLRRVGELWAAESLCPAQERLLSTNLRGVLAWLMESMPVPGGAPVVLATTPALNRHELGAMLAGVVAAEEGWRVVYLGPDLPAADIAAAASITGARVVALSVVYAEEARSVRSEIADLRATLADGVELVVGGAGAVAETARLSVAGATVLPDLAALRALLRAAASRSSEESGYAEGER